MANMIEINQLDVGCNGIENVLLSLLQDRQELYTYACENSKYYRYLLQTAKVYRNFFVDYEKIDLSFFSEFRKEIYAQGSTRELLLVDALLAILRIKIERSAFNLLPQYSKIAEDDWRNVLKQHPEIKELWPAQIKLGEAGVFSGKSAVIQMPTSSGKTTSISMTIRAAFLSNRTALAVVVVPFRALCREISSDLSKDFVDDANIRINELSDALEIDDILDLETFFATSYKNIMILTPEKMIYLWRQEPEIFRELGLAIFDEAHLFDDTTRGARYELLLATIIGYLSTDTQRLLISAVIPNARELNAWFTLGEGAVIADNTIKSSEKSISFCDWSHNYGYLYFVDSENVENEDFYVPRVIEIQRLNKLSNREKVERIFPQVDFKKKKVEYNDIAIYLANNLNVNGGVAIFCGRKKTADNILDRILEIEQRGIDISSFLLNSDKNEYSKISKLIEENYGNNSIYCRAANKGIFIHHGGISEGIRISVEFAMRKDLIRCIVCTSTLAQGVNLPIKYLIISSLYQASEKIKVRDFHNLIGRAGRAGLFTEGTVILTEPFVYSAKRGWKWRQYKEMLDKSNSESCLSRLLLLVRPENFELSYEESWIIPFYDLAVDYYNNRDSYEKKINVLFSKQQKSYPNKGYALDNLITEFLNCLEAVESYLLYYLSNDDIVDTIDEVVEDTFGYYLASEDER